MILTLSVSVAFAAEGTELTQSSQDASAAQTLNAATDAGTTAEASTQTDTDTQADTTPTGVIKKGSYYYYVNPKNGVLRKKKGFVTWNNNKYYIKKGGKIVTGKTFKVGKKQYRAHKDGRIATGVYKWGKKYSYSDPKTGRWLKKTKFVKWNGNKYRNQKNGTIIVKKPFVVKNVPYEADAKGVVRKLPVDNPTNSKVLKVAQKQVGKMTGVTYWKWYFKSRFIDTDRTPWCATFVAWCYNKAGYYDKIAGVKKFGNLGYVPSYSRYASKHNKWVKTASAKPGDIIIFGHNRHVGLVEKVHNGYVFTVEGNSGPTAAIGSRKPGAVTRKVYSLKDKDIKGVMRVVKN